jgi:hypothetical protein
VVGWGVGTHRMERDWPWGAVWVEWLAMRHTLGFCCRERGRRRGLFVLVSPCAITAMSPSSNSPSSSSLCHSSSFVTIGGAHGRPPRSALFVTFLPSHGASWGL